MAKSSPLNVAVLGTGMSATVFHIPFIQSLPELFTLHTIWERKATPAHAVARERYGSGVRVVTSYDEVLQNSDVHIVVVSTPNSTHVDYARRALDAGKHVILEKPVTLSSASANELIQLSRAHGVISAFHNRRFDADFLALSDLLKRGELGTIVDLESRYDRWRPALRGGGTWKEKAEWGTGALWDLGSHLLDQVFHLFGTPAKLFAHLRNSRGLGDPAFFDAFSVQLYYASGLVVHVAGTPLSALEPQIRFVVRGTGGGWVKHGIDAQEAQLNLSPPLPLADPSFGVEDPSYVGVLTKPGEKPVPTPSPRGEYIEWYRKTGAAFHAQDESLLPSSPESARDVIRAIELLYRSAEEGTVVSWSDRDD